MSKKEQERILIKKAQDGDKARDKLLRARSETVIRQLERVIRDGNEARNTLLMQNINLVRRWAKRYTLHGSEREDLVQEGMIGFRRGIGKFDLTCNNQLSTYALFWARREMDYYLKTRDRIIRVPKQWENYNVQQFALDSFGRSTENEVLNRPASKDDPEFYDNLKLRITKALDTPRERLIVLLRFEQNCTLQHIADTVGCTKERVRQLLNEITAKLYRRLAHVLDPRV